MLNSKKLIQKSFLLAIVFSLLFGACKEDEKPMEICGTSNPTKENAWIKSAIEEINNSEFGRQHSIINSGKFEGNTYLFIGTCCASCNWVTIFYNCQGEAIVEPDFAVVDLEDVQVIYKHEEFNCG
jgi:hypothetical protein